MRLVQVSRRAQRAENSIPIAMVSDVCHWRELNSQGKKGVLLAIFLLSIATVLTKSIIRTQNSLLWLGGDNSFKSHFCWNSYQKAVVLKICCWKSSNRSTLSGTTNVLCKFGQEQCFLISNKLSQDRPSEDSLSSPATQLTLIQLVLAISQRQNGVRT